MRSRLQKGRLQKIGEVLGGIIGVILDIIIDLLNLILKKLIARRVAIRRMGVFFFVLYGLCSFFIQVANAPKADASQPYSPKFSVDLPMKVTPDMNTREVVLSLVKEEFGEDQVNSFDQIVIHESGWDPQAVNPNGGACGLFQSLPCSKMGGMDLHTQINFGFDYIKSRYGTPNNAWKFWQTKHLVDGKWVNYY